MQGRWLSIAGEWGGCRIYTVDCRWVDSGGGGVGWLSSMGEGFAESTL